MAQKSQGQRTPCNSEGAQASGMRTISYLGGSEGVLPLEFFFLQGVLLRPSDSSLEAF